MSRIDNTRAIYETKIRGALESGERITVVGMKASNHSPFTKRWEQAGLIVFQEASSKSHIGGLVVRLRFNRHTNQKGSPNLVISLGVLKKVLGNLTSYLEAREADNVQNAKGEHPGDTSLGALNLKPKTVNPPIIVEEKPKEEGNMTTASRLVATLPQPNAKEQAFALAVMESLHGNPRGVISAVIAQRLTNRHMHSVRPRSIPNLLTPVVVKGKKVSNYTPSEYLLDLASVPRVEVVTPPVDPFERAKWLVANEQALTDQVAELEARLALAKAELTKVARAKELLKSITEL